jgi:hypothetical protein
VVADPSALLKVPSEIGTAARAPPSPTAVDYLSQSFSRRHRPRTTPAFLYVNQVLSVKTPHCPFPRDHGERCFRSGTDIHEYSVDLRTDLSRVFVSSSVIDSTCLSLLISTGILFPQEFVTFSFLNALSCMIFCCLSPPSLLWTTKTFRAMLASVRASWNGASRRRLPRRQDF